MDVQDLDHLGIIAGIIDQMGLEARVNDCLGTHPQQKVSPGQGLKAMILNGLGFVSAPLYLYEGFFNGKATEHLLGEGKVDFNCAEDARHQALALAARWRYHTLAAVQVVEHPHYERAGRPKAGEPPSRITYRLTAQVVADEAGIAQAKRKAGRFILATNAIDDPTMTAEQVLSDYKGQYAPERSFGLLKDPLFFTSSVFLKTPQRIAALAMVMGLAVMVYTLAQRQLRQALP